MAVGLLLLPQCIAAKPFYSWMVNVNCLLRLFSKRLGGLISSKQLIPMAITKPRMKQTKMADHIGAVVNPTQSIAESKRLPRRFGCACCEREKMNKFLVLPWVNFSYIIQTDKRQLCHYYYEWKWKRKNREKEMFYTRDKTNIKKDELMILRIGWLIRCQRNERRKKKRLCERAREAINKLLNFA